MDQAGQQKGPPRGGAFWRPRLGLVGVGGLVVGRGVLGATFALLEPVAVAVHPEDMDMVGEAIEQRAGEPFGGDQAGPLVERRFDVTMVEPRS